jgi:hypothetical protein
MDGMTILPRLAALTLLLLPLAACGRDRASSAEAGPGPFARQLAEAVPRVEAAVGLTFREPPRVEARSREEVGEFLQRRLLEERSQRELRGLQVLYSRLGLIPQNMDLQAFLMELLQEQVVGYYDPGAQVLYVVEGAAPDQAATVLYHELVHALQDQYMDLDSIQRVEGNSDRQLAAQAVIEGQATLKSMEAMLGEDVFARLPGGWDRVRQMIREQSATMPIFAGAPYVLQESLIFPYLNGAEFVRRFEEQRPGQSVLDAMPTSSSHILRTDTYFSPEPLEPRRPLLPAPRTGRVVHEDNFGEFMIRIFLFDHLRNQAEAIRAAAGWRGDRYHLLEADAGDALVWVTLWANAGEADEFVTSLARYPQRRYRGVTEAAGTPAGTHRFTAGDRELLIRRFQTDGHEAVLFVDAPAQTGVELVDLASVRVE